MLVKLPALIGPTLIAVFLTALVHAHPIWNIFNTRNSIDSLVTGSSVLLAGGVKFGVLYYLTTPSPPGTSAVGTDAHEPRLTRGLQARPETSRYLSYPAGMKPRYSSCTIVISFITPTIRTSSMSTS